MGGILSGLLASISLGLRQPLTSFCDVESTHGDHLVTKRGEYVSVLRINGLRRMCTRQEVEALAEQQRIELQGLLEERGHAIVGWYISDPERSGIEIDRLSLDGCRSIARQIGADLTDVIGERRRRWPNVMRWEATYYVLWTRPSVLTREDRKQVAEERKALAAQFPRVGDSQRFAVRSDIMAARHESFISRVQTTMQGFDISCEFLNPHHALQVAREAIYRETAGSAWKPTLLGDRVMPRLPDDLDNPKPHPQGLLWPAIRDQIFNADAETKGGQLVTVGDYTYAPVDMAIGPEDPRPFAELSSVLGRKRLPWRSAMILEGGGRAAFGFKEAGAGFLAMFPGNGDIRRAFATLKHERQKNNHNSVRMRMTATTWAPIGEDAKLRRQASDLAQAIDAWGNSKTTRISGDPLEAAMGSVPALSLGSTATSSLALVGDAFAMMPWARSASPWQRGSILFRKPDGSIWPYDPTGGGLRPSVVDIIVAPPGGGKSVLANTILLGLILSSAAISSHGTKLPFIGKLDIGPSSRGLIEMLRNALGPERQHEAVYVKMQAIPGFEVNVFDTQVGLEYPLPLERVFLQNFISLLATPLEGKPWEGMDHLVEDVVDEAYRLCTGVQGGAPKIYTPGIEPEVDAVIISLGISLPHHAGEDEPTWWRDVVNALIDVKEYRLAGFAQRHAVPILQDLLMAARSPEIEKRYSKITLETGESLIDTFDRYIMNVIKNFPMLASPTKLDMGNARVIVLDLAEVAPSGSPGANRQTALMYMLGRQILARNFFLHPDYADDPNMPASMRDYHLARFTEMYETLKRLDFDEWHRTEPAPQVDRQAVRDGREGRKHNVQLCFISQNHTDFSEDLYKISTARWVLKCGDQETADSLIKRFKLSDASAYVIRNALPGPGKDGAPFFVDMSAGEAKYEQLLINVLGPIELWSFSTTPGDTALRARLYKRIHFARALRMLATVFPSGSANSEIERRKSDRMNDLGLATEEAFVGVLDELADEIVEGRGVAAGLYETLRAIDEHQEFAITAE